MAVSRHPGGSGRTMMACLVRSAGPPKETRCIMLTLRISAKFDRAESNAKTLTLVIDNVSHLLEVQRINHLVISIVLVPRGVPCLSSVTGASSSA